MATLEAPVRRALPASRPIRHRALLRFSQRRERHAAWRRHRQSPRPVGTEYDLIIAAKRVKDTDKIKSLNPSQPSQVVGLQSEGGQGPGGAGHEAALTAFDSWSRTTVERAGQPAVPRGRPDALAQNGIHGMADL